MANYSILKAAITAAIKQNGNNEITGALLQQQLLSMVNTLGAGFLFAGIATPSTNPGTPDQNVFYLASTAGTYTNFGGLVLAEGEVAVLKYNGAWSKDSTGVASLETVNQIQQEITEDISQLGQEIENIFASTVEDGFFVVDNNLNVGFCVDSEGAHAKNLSESALSDDMALVEEDGYFFVDERLNIGVSVDSNGVQSKNILKYIVVEN